MSSPLASSRKALTSAACRDSARQWPTSIESPDRETHTRACTTTFVPGALDLLYARPAGLIGDSTKHPGRHGLRRTEGPLKTMRGVSEDIIGGSLLRELMEVKQPALEDTAGALLHHRSTSAIGKAHARPELCAFPRSHFRGRDLCMT